MAWKRDLIINKGSFGTVYKVKHTETNRIAALKEIHEEHINKRDFFFNAFTAMKNIEDVNCTQMIEWTGNGNPSFVMEFVEGKPISVLKDKPAEKIIGSIIQVCNGLDALHSRNIVYRDLKPGNILINSDNIVKIVDYDLIKIDNDEREKGLFIGTPQYASPEHFYRIPEYLDSRSDLYSLGVILYELIFSKIPFDGNFEKLKGQHRYKNVIFPQNKISLELQNIIQTLMAKDKKDRYQNAKAVADALKSTPEGKNTATEVRAKGAYLLKPQFVDRIGQRKILQESFENEVIKEKGKTIIISGASGIGKTWLWNDIQKKLEAEGIETFYAKSEDWGIPSDRVLGDIILKLVDSMKDKSDNEKRKCIGTFGWDLARVAPELNDLEWLQDMEKPPALTDYKAAEIRLQSAITDFMKNLVEKPIIICLDDLQWTSERVIEWIFYASRNIKDKPIYLIGIYRKDTLFKDEAKEVNKSVVLLETKLPEMEDDGFIKPLIIEPFNEEYASEMLASMLGIAKNKVEQNFIQEMMNRTSGSPLFIWQNMQYLVQNDKLKRNGKWKLEDIEFSEIPEEQEEIIQRRLSNLPSKVRGVLQKASLIGRVFEFEIISQIVDIDEVTLRNYLEVGRISQVIQGIGEDKYQFIFDAEREWFEESIESEKKQRLHRQIGEILEEKHKDDKDSIIDELARHFYEAGIKEKAIEYCGRAGDLAKEKYENEKILLMYDHAMKMCKKIGKHQKAISFLWEKASIYDVIGDWNKAVQALQKGIASAEKNGYYKKRALLGSVLGSIFWKIGDDEKALNTLKKSQELAEALEDPKLIGSCLINQGIIYVYKNHDKAEEYFKKAINVLMEKEHNEKEISDAYNNIGSIYLYKGNYDVALKFFEKSLKIRKKIGSGRLISDSTLNIGLVHYSKDDYVQSLKYIKDSLKVKEKIGEKQNISICLHNLGIIHYFMRNYEFALDIYKKLISILEELGDKRMLSVSLENMGNIYKRLKLLDNAEECYNKSIEIATNLNFSYCLCGSFVDIGDLYFSIGRLNKAFSFTSQAIDIAEKINRKDVLLHGKLILAKINFETNKREIAIQQLYDMLTNTTDKTESSIIHYELWKMFSQLEDKKDKAQEHRQKAIEIYQKLQEKTPEKYDYIEKLEELKNE